MIHPVYHRKCKGTWIRRNIMMKKKVKILYFQLNVDIAGGEIMLYELLKHLNRNKYNPVVLLPKKGELYNRINELEIPIYIIAFKGFRKINPVPFLKTIFEICKIATVEKIDLIYANTEKLNRFSVVCSKLLRIPSLCHLHLILDRQPISQQFLKLNDKIIAVSKAAATPLINAGIPKEKIEIIHSSVDCSKFYPNKRRGRKIRSAFGIKDEDFLIVEIGRISEEKGLHILIDAILKIHKTVEKKVFLFIVGHDNPIGGKWFSKEYIDLLKRKILDNGLHENVIFTGFRKDTADIYNSMDLFVAPSIWEEPCAVVLVEAMAVGKPLVSTKVGGTPEIIKEGYNGLLAKPNNIDSLVACVKYMIENSEFRRRIGENAYQSVLSHYEIKKNVLKHEQLYEQMLEL